MADVNITRILARRNGIKSTRFTWPNSHYTAEWLVGNMNIRSEFAGCLPQLIVMKVRLWEIFSQQAKSWNNSIPAPALMFDTDDIDHKCITWFRTLHIYRAGKWVNEVEV